MFSHPLYAASKAAIVSMVKSLGPLKETTGIRNAAICPGAVRVRCCPCQSRLFDFSFFFPFPFLLLCVF